MHSTILVNFCLDRPFRGIPQMKNIPGLIKLLSRKGLKQTHAKNKPTKSTKLNDEFKEVPFYIDHMSHTPLKLTKTHFCLVEHEGQRKYLSCLQFCLNFATVFAMFAVIFGKLKLIIWCAFC